MANSGVLALVMATMNFVVSVTYALAGDLPRTVYWVVASVLTGSTVWTGR